MNQFLGMDLPELRRRLDEHQVTRPADVFSSEMAPWMKTKDQITFAIELKEAEASQKPFFITVPPQPPEFASSHPAPKKPSLARHSQAAQKLPIPPPTQEVRHADSPGNAGAPGALAASEEAMPQTRRGLPAADPGIRIEHLVNRIKAASKKGEKLYWAQQEIRAICTANGLQIPPEAQKTRGTKQPAPPDLPTAEPGSPGSDMPGGKTTVEIWVRGLKRWQLNTPLCSPRLNADASALMAGVLLMEGSMASAQEWRQIARDLAILETTAGAARQIAERHAGVA